MSDEEQRTSDRARRLAAFNWESFLAHAERHGGLNPCEGCGSSDWTVTLQPNGKPDILASPMYMSESMYLVMPVTCGKCGNMRMFNVGMMADKGANKSDT